MLCVNFLPSRVLCHVIRDERDILHDISWQWPPFRCGVQEASTPSSSHLNHVSCNSVWANIELGGVWCNVLRTVSKMIFRSGPAKTTSSRVKILLLLCISSCLVQISTVCESCSRALFSRILCGSFYASCIFYSWHSFFNFTTSTAVWHLISNNLTWFKN